MFISDVPAHHWLKIILAVCTISVFSASTLITDTWAQGGGNDQGWTPPISLYQIPTDSYDPAIAADPSGRVHVFWGESLDAPSSEGSMIMYTYWDGGSWSPPTDILIAPDGFESRSWQPAPAVSANGQLHLLWAGGFASHIYHSSARADQALSAAAWSKPQELDFMGNASSPHIVIDDQDIIHVVFTIPTGPDQGIYYLRSQNGGQDWTLPELIPDTRVDPEAHIRNGRLAVGGDGTLHVAWWWTTEEFPPKGVMYIRSTDGGSTWSDLLSMEGPLQELDVAAVGEQEVHLVWSSTTPERYKWYRRSDDGGRTWTPATRWPQLGGFHGWTGMAVDSDGVLHLGIVASHSGIQAKRNEALLHVQWGGQSWSEPEIVFRNPPIEEENLKNAAIAISEGNLVHLVVQYPVPADQRRPYQYDIYYSRRRVDSSYIAPQRLPTVTPAPSLTVQPTPTPLAQPTITPTPRSTLAAASDPDPSSIDRLSTGPGLPILVGIGPALLVLVGVLLIRLGRYERR